MSSPTDKPHRKLQILPEILPTPTVSAGDRPSPRDRTMSRLSKLMAVAATGAALAGCGDDSAGSTGGAATTGAAPSTSSAGATASATATSTAAATPSATATATAAADAPDAGAGDAGSQDAGADAAPPGSAKVKPAQQQPPKRDRGYQVVDMLPAPSRGGGTNF